MTNRTYPCFGTAYSLDTPTSCAPCPTLAARQVHLQIGIFRGDDLVAALCPAQVEQAKLWPGDVVEALWGRQGGG